MKVYDIINKTTGKDYSCIPQMVDLKHDGRYVLRYIVFIDGWHDFGLVHCIYSDDEFNRMYEVVGTHEARNESLR